MGNYDFVKYPITGKSTPKVTGIAQFTILGYDTKTKTVKETAVYGCIYVDDTCSLELHDSKGFIYRAFLNIKDFKTFHNLKVAYGSKRQQFDVYNTFAFGKYATVTMQPDLEWFKKQVEKAEKK